MDGNRIVRWLGVGLDERGRFVGLCPLKTVTGANLIRDFVSPEGLITLKERSITSTPTSSRRKIAAPVIRPLSKWTAEDFHSYFQEKMRTHFGGYPGLSHKDRTNWDFLISGFDREVIVSMVDALVLRHPEAVRTIDKLPSDTPSVGILRGWSTSICAWVHGRLSEKPKSVRESAKPAHKGKF